MRNRVAPFKGTVGGVCILKILWIGAYSRDTKYSVLYPACNHTETLGHDTIHKRIKSGKTEPALCPKCSRTKGRTKGAKTNAGKKRKAPKKPDDEHSIHLWAHQIWPDPQS